MTRAMATSVRSTALDCAARHCLTENTLLAWAAGELLAEGLRPAEAHLAGCDDCRELMAEVLHGVEGFMPGEARGPCPAPGDLLADKYRVEALVATGGMGLLFSARHVERDQLVAIKVLHSPSAHSAARFLREGRIYSRLSGPHIPKIYDLGCLANGAPFLAMELLAGEDLSCVVARGPAPLPAVASHGVQACAALSVVHRVGIVHRDIKPANFFLVPQQDGTQLLKLLDFGISKFSELERTRDLPPCRETSQLLGSPLYMSPEQLQDSKEVDHRADIWSLGVVLYQLLTGRTPFHSSSLSGLCVAITTHAPRPPSTLRPGLPPALDDIILRCLAKRREERLSQLQELADVLEALC